MSNDKELAQDLLADGVYWSVTADLVDPEEFEDPVLNEVLDDAIGAFEDLRNACIDAVQALQNFVDLN